MKSFYCLINSKNYKQQSRLMGSQRSSVRDTVNFNINEWSQLYREGQIRILNNKQNPSLQIEEYPFQLNSRRDIELSQQIIKIRRCDPYLVCVIHSLFFNSGPISYQPNISGLIFTQRIHARLNNAGLVGFPGSLHLIAQSIYGFQKLVKYFQYFRVVPSCIGVNQQQVVKVWHHPNFGSLYPLQSVSSEEQMIISILDSIEPYVDYSSRQLPSFRQFLTNHRTPLAFEAVKIKLFEYARYFNESYIPKNISFFLPKRPVSLRQTVHYNNIGSLNNNWNGHQNVGLRMSNPVPSFSTTSPELPTVNTTNFAHYQPIYKHQGQTHHQNHHIHPMVNNRAQIWNQGNNIYKINQSQQFHFLHQHQPQHQHQHQHQQQQMHIPIFVPPMQQHHYQNFAPVNYHEIHMPQSNLRPMTQTVPYTTNLRSSKISDSSSRSHSVQSQRLEFRNKPLSIQFHQRNDFVRNDSRDSLFDRQLQNPMRQRSHSNIHSYKPKSITVPSSTSQLHYQNSQYARLSGNIHIGHGQRPLKPMQIRHAIQGTQFRQANHENILTKTIKPQYIITERNYNLDSSQTAPIKILSKSQNLLVPNQSESSEKPSPSFGIDEFSSPVQNRQAEYKNPIPVKNLINELNDKKIDETVESSSSIAWKQFTHSKKQKNSVNFDDQKQQLALLPQTNVRNQQKQSKKQEFAKRQQTSNKKREKINLNDVRESQSINNSLKNFYSHNFTAEDYPQAFEVSSPVQYQLSAHNKANYQGDDGIIINKLNLFEKREEFTPLDLMGKLKITETIRKEDNQNDKLEVPVSDNKQKVMKERSRSRQFCKDVAKLGFLMNEEQLSNSTPTSSRDGKPMISKQLVNQWTPTYKDEPQTEVYTIRANNQRQQHEWSQNYLDGKNNNMNHNKFQWSTSEPVPVQRTKVQTKAGMSYPTYEKQSEKYEFEWDPQILNDIEAKVHNGQIID